jgi:hypothetical protein
MWFVRKEHVASLITSREIVFTIMTFVVVMLSGDWCGQRVLDYLLRTRLYCGGRMIRLLAHPPSPIPSP